MTRPATERQTLYLRRLLQEAFARRIEHGTCLDAHHLDRVDAAYASQCIDELRRLLGQATK